MAKSGVKANQNPAGPPINIPEGVSEFYVNSLNVMMTPWDFILLYGSVALPPSIATGRQTLKGEIRVDAAIRMSPQHAKASIRAMQSMIDEYEKLFGEITIPSEESVSEDK